MGIVLDVIVLAIIGITAVISAKKGFVATVVELVGLVLAFYLAFTLSSVAANFTYDKFISPSIKETIVEEIGDSVNKTADSVWESLPGIVVSGANTLGIEKEDVFGGANDTASSTIEDIANTVDVKIARPVITTFIRFILGFILFIACIFLIKILAKLLNKLFSFSIIGKLNKLLGAVLGAGKGMVFATVFVLLLSTIAAVTKNGFLIFTNENIEKSAIFDFIAGFNPFYK